MSPLLSTLLKTWSGLTRWLLGALLLGWLLFGAVWGAVHWLIVPRIGDLRPQLEARASAALGIAVRIGDVLAQSNGLMPSFALHQVTLVEPNGRVALSLPRVLVTLSPRSLLRLGFEQVVIDEPQLDVRRSPDGRMYVAGLNLSGGPDTGGQVQDWFFSQIEFVIRGGQLRWTDEQRGLAPLVLQQVEVLVRNLGRHHDLRLDATPPPEWGARFVLQARFLQPRLAHQNGQWSTWDGQVFADFSSVDVSTLSRYVALGFDLTKGRGALRTWVDLRQGQPTGVTADIALTEFSAVLGQDLPALTLQRIQGRLQARRLDNGFEFTTQSLAFDTADGRRWPGGNVRLVQQRGQSRMPPGGELQADRLDLSALSQIASSLPLDAHWREQLSRHAPAGQVQRLSARWQGPLSAPTTYAAQGRLSRIGLAAVEAAPGLKGVDIDFDFDQRGGSASIAVAEGSVDLPGIFQQSQIAIAQLSANARWQLDGEKIAVQVNNLKFANADAQGQGQIRWQTSDPKKSGSKSRFPGLLDLQATLSRADGRQVHRYLPLVINPLARDYVREAVQAGSASNVRFVVKGDIFDIPATEPRLGKFRISADVKDARLVYLPPALQEANDKPWPALNALSGELVIDGLRLVVKNARGYLGETAAVQLSRADATIADLLNAEVRVNAELKAPLPAALHLVNQSPLADLTAHALARSTMSGAADFDLKLTLPIANIFQSTVQGSVVLSGNDVQISPETPKISRAKGRVNFSHTGVALAGIQARMYGGEVLLDGGLQFAEGDMAAPTSLRASGTATTEGLQQATELGWVSRLARLTSGSASYTATLGLRQSAPELLVTSNLQGLAARLPAPLNKAAQSSLPLRYQTSVLDPPPAGAPKRVRDRLSVTLGQTANVLLERDLSDTQTRILRGTALIGNASATAPTLPERGIHARLHLPEFDADAWATTLAQLDPLAAGDTGTTAPLTATLMPERLTVQTERLTYGERQFTQVVLGATHEAGVWRANMQSSELEGYLEYQSSLATHAAARLFARLKRLTLTPGTSSNVEALLDAPATSVPALDVVVDDFELRGKRLGRLEVNAINHTPAGTSASEWRLTKLALSVPEASLNASGQWGLPPTGQRMTTPQQRRISLLFDLDIKDGGALLSRFGMKDLVRQGSGKMQGELAWMGSPTKIDYPSLQGGFSVNILTGQFLQADPGLAKLLGVLSLQALPRRLSLDFRDVFSQGFAFDFLRGNIAVDKGQAYTNNLQMKGVNAAVLMEGSADIARETQDLRVVVVPELNAGTAALIATAINPAVGLGSFLAQLFLRRPLVESATQEFHVDGPWADPQVRKVPLSQPAIKESSP